MLSGDEQLEQIVHVSLSAGVPGHLESYKQAFFFC